MKGAVLACIAFSLTACVAAHRDRSTLVVSKGDDYLAYGVEAFAAGQPAVAASRFRWALGIFERSGDLDGQIRAHINLAEQALQIGDLAGTDAHLRRIETLIGQGGASTYLRRVHLIRSSQALALGDYSGAHAQLRRLLGSDQCPTAIDDADSLAVFVLANRTTLASETDEAGLPCWTAQLRQAFSAAAQGDVYLEARLLRFEAELQRRQQAYTDADAGYERALALYRAGLRQAAQAATLQEWATLDIEREYWGSAGEKLRQSIALHDALDDRQGVLAGLRLLARVESQSGHAQSAAALEQLVLALEADGNNAAGAGIEAVLGATPEVGPAQQR